MRSTFWISLLWVLLSLSSGAQSQSPRRLAIPSYASPTSAEWNTWQSMGSKAVGIMVLNLNNGDDTALNAAVAAAVKHTQDSGILVLGYIHTGYAQRDPVEVRAKIDGVVENYKVDGILLDETPTDCLAAGKYAPPTAHTTKLSPATSETNPESTSPP